MNLNCFIYFLFFLQYMQTFCVPGLTVFSFSILHSSNMFAEANMVHLVNPEIRNISLNVHKSSRLCLTAFCSVTWQPNNAGALIIKHVLRPGLNEIHISWTECSERRTTQSTVCDLLCRLVLQRYDWESCGETVAEGQSWNSLQSCFI